MKQMEQVRKDLFIFIVDLTRLRSFTGQVATNDSQNADGGKSVCSFYL